jgi:hypothetical protein
MSLDPHTLAAAEQARNVAVQMMSERGRGLVLVGAARLGLIEPPIEQALHAIRSVSSGSTPRLSAHPSGRPWLPSSSGSPLSRTTNRRSSCWSRSWWRPSRAARYSRCPFLHGRRSDSRANERTRCPGSIEMVSQLLALGGFQPVQRKREWESTRGGCQSGSTR